MLVVPLELNPIFASYLSNLAMQFEFQSCSPLFSQLQSLSVNLISVCCIPSSASLMKILNGLGLRTKWQDSTKYILPFLQQLIDCCCLSIKLRGVFLYWSIFISFLQASSLSFLNVDFCAEWSMKSFLSPHLECIYQISFCPFDLEGFYALSFRSLRSSVQLTLIRRSQI